MIWNAFIWVEWGTFQSLGNFGGARGSFGRPAGVRCSAGVQTRIAFIAGFQEKGFMTYVTEYSQ